MRGFTIFTVTLKLITLTTISITTLLVTTNIFVYLTTVLCVVGPTNIHTTLGILTSGPSR